MTIRAPALRIAVAGAGGVGRRHTALLREYPETVLCALIDPSPHARLLAEQEGVPAFASVEQFFDDGQRADGMILATPNHAHLAGAMSCLRHGVPALIERPVAAILADAQRLVIAQGTASVPLLVGHHRRHSPVLARARQHIAEGKLGSIVSLAGSALFHKPASYFTNAPWRSGTGGGPILINLTNEIDIMRYLLGEITAVQAMSSNAQRGFPVEDSVVVTLRFASGALGSFTLSDTAAAPPGWDLCGAGEQAGEDTYFIAGTQGSIALPSLRSWANPARRHWQEPLCESTLACEADDAMQRQLTHFCQVVRGEAAPLVTVKEAAESLRVTLAVADAARRGTTVYLDKGR